MPGSVTDPTPVALPESLGGPLRSRAFRWFFLSRTVSVMGSAMTPVALAFSVLEMTSDARWLGFVLSAEIIPMIGLIVLGGGVADRYPRDHLLRWTTLGAGISQAAVAACVLTRQPVVALIPLAAVNGTLQAFTGPALQGIVPQLVGRQSVQSANSLLATSRNIARVFGPTLAGVFAATSGGGWAIALDAASFLLAAGCLLKVSIPAGPARVSRRLLTDLRQGWSYFRSTRWLWSVTLVFTVMNAVQMGVWQVLGPVIAKSTFGPGSWGVVQSVKAAGLLLASVIMIRITIRRPLVSGLLWMSVTAVPMLLLGLGMGVAWLAVAAFLSGLGSAYFAIVWDSTRQQRIPANMISRAASYDDLGAFVAIPIGQLSVIPVASGLGIEQVAIWGALVYALAALTPLVLGSIRSLEPDPPAQPA